MLSTAIQAVDPICFLFTNSLTFANFLMSQLNIPFEISYNTFDLGSQLINPQLLITVYICNIAVLYFLVNRCTPGVKGARGMKQHPQGKQ